VYAIPDPPDPENPIAVYQALGLAVDSVYRLRVRIVGRLCVFAETIEVALGLEPGAQSRRDEGNPE